MRRLSLRWQLIVPRLLLVVVAVLSAQYVLGVAARWLAGRVGEAAIAANVEVTTARVSLLDRKIVLGELSVGNPRRPQETLLQADCCELDVAVAPIFHKRAIIDRGRVTGLRVHAASGSPADYAEPKPRPTHTWLTNHPDEPAREWLAQLQQRFRQQSIEQLECIGRSEALWTRWSEENAARNKRAAELIRRAAELQQEADAAEANRLRHDEFLSALPSEIAALQQEFAEFDGEIEKFAASLEAERRAIVAARQRDEGVFRDGFHLGPIDANSFTAYLLGEQLAGPLDELIGWLRWSREVVPVESTTPTRRKRGEDILFTGCGPTPNFLIRVLQLQGSARLGEQSVELRGLLTDVSNMPLRHNAPMRLRLTSSGSLPLELQATIDRTGDVARDELLVDCRGVALPAVRLGRSGELEMGLAPSIGSLSISVAVEGEKLSGDVQLVQKRVRVTPALHGELADVPLVVPLQATLGKINSVATRVSLQGTLEEPSCTLWSNLGPAVAEALVQSLRRAADERAQFLLAEARRQVDERLADLERRLAAEQTKLAAQLNGANDRLERLARHQTRRGRISAERLGGRLPANSLFR